MKPSCPNPPAPLKRGDKRNTGQYWHNLKSGDLSRRYADDTETPKFGWRLRPDRWNWAPDGLSANISTCVCSTCSVELQGDDRYVHALRVDLNGLSRLMEVTLIAEYQPLSPPEHVTDNPCHFVLYAEDLPPEECSGIAFVAFRRTDGQFPGGVGSKTPQKREQQVLAIELSEDLDRILHVVRSVKDAGCRGPGPEVEAMNQGS
jgi:hypothetical protein